MEGISIHFVQGREAYLYLYAVASFAAETVAFAVDFLVSFLEGLLPIRVFFVIAIVDSSRICI